MRLTLIPVRDRCHVVLPLEEAAMAHADLLHGHAQIGAETDRIGRIGGQSSL